MRSKKSPLYTIRAVAGRHAKPVIQMTYASFPFQEKEELELLGSSADVHEWYSAEFGQGVRKEGFHLVAVDNRDKLLGFVAVRRLLAGNARVSSSVCSLARIAVAPQYRAAGVGQALLKRAVATAKNVGYGEVMAAIPDRLVPWYRKQQWEVGESGHLYALLEQPHPGDDGYGPAVIPKFRGTFAPIQSQKPGPVEHGYTRIAHRRTGAESELIHTWTAADDLEATRTLWRSVCERPQLITDLPLMTLASLVKDIKPPTGDDFAEQMVMRLIAQRLSS